MKQIKPVREKIVVKPRDAETQTAGGIVIPDTAKDRANQGEVVAVGPGRLLDDGTEIQPVLKPGDQVLFIPDVGWEFEHNDDKLLSLTEAEIIAKIEE